MMKALLGAHASAVVSEEFAYTGAAQTFVVPAGVTRLHVTIAGASGGDEYAPGNTIPVGSLVEADIPVTPGETLQINVGGAGGTGASGVGGAAGWNGGGAGAQGAGGGGGASDIRRGGTATSDRVIVAAGAGGNGANMGGTGASKGGNGGLPGAAGQNGANIAAGAGGGATAAAVGAAGTGAGGTSGSAGSGATGGAGGAGTSGIRGGGGAGGGYCGGGGGGGCSAGRTGGGGGAGSSYVVPGATSVTFAPATAGDGSVTLTSTVAAPDSPFSFLDEFDRADAATLGSPWSIDAYTFAIDTSLAKVTTTGTVVAVATVEADAPDMAIEWDMTVWPKGPVYAIFRYVDTSNYWFVCGTNSSSDPMYLFRVVGGVSTMMESTTGVTWGAGYRLRVETAQTGEISVQVDDVVKLSRFDSVHATATRAGLGGYCVTFGTSPYLSTARWSRFAIDSPI